MFHFDIFSLSFLGFHIQNPSIPYGREATGDKDQVDKREDGYRSYSKLALFLIQNKGHYMESNWNNSRKPLTSEINSKLGSPHSLFIKSFFLYFKCLYPSTSVNNMTEGKHENAGP